MPTYIRVKWIHPFRDEPRWLYSELDAERWEVRKVEQFPDGRLGFADADSSSGDTRLGEVQVPSLAEIGAISEFRPAEITKAEFEAIWRRATRPPFR